MIRQIVRDPIFLSQRADPAGEADIAAADDLRDTLLGNADRCVGMAANMIGIKKRIIVFDDEGKIGEMFNPEIVSAKEPYQTEEGCLSLEGVREVRRYRRIKVRWQDRQFRVRIKTFTGQTAQIIQHEIDHTNGILI